MTGMLEIMIRVYRFLLRLYPGSFRREFEQQMLLDFADMAVDVRDKGRSSFVFFCLRELVDFPVNLLRVHFAQGHIFKMLRSQPVNNGLRGATGFGAGFAFTSAAAWLVSGFVYSMFDLLVQSLSGGTSAGLHTKSLYLIPFAIYLILTSTIFGLLLALFQENRAKFYRYVLSGALCWVIPEIVSYVLVWSLREAYYHNENLTPILGYSMCILIGTFLSAAYLIAESERKESRRYLLAGIVVYPLATYLFIRFLFYLWGDVTPSFSFSLLTFMIGLIVCVVTMTMPGRRKLHFVVISGGIGYFLLNRILFYVASRIPGFSLALDMGIIPDVLAMPVYYMAIYKAVFGAFFGLSIGWMLGLVQKADSKPVAASA